MIISYFGLAIAAEQQELSMNGDDYLICEKLCM